MVINFTCYSNVAIFVLPPSGVWAFAWNNAKKRPHKCGACNAFQYIEFTIIPILRSQRSVLYDPAEAQMLLHRLR
jgi:hypothetical protein